jgi:hypothetical protein
MPPQKRFATLKDQIIQAVLGNHYKFATEEQATTQLDIIKSLYFISKHKDHKDTPTSCTLWVRDYDITPEQKEQGALGNFLKIHCVKTEPKQFGFFVRKVDIELSVHPQRKRVDQRHPNWGHPVLRSIEKKRTYPTVENAQAELTLLQQEYPHAAVPGPNKLYLMIFGRAEGKEKRVKKYVLEIKTAEKGGYYIDCTLNVPKPKQPKPAKPKPPAATMDKTEQKPLGEFTAKLALKRNKKKK